MEIICEESLKEGGCKDAKKWGCNHVYPHEKVIWKNPLISKEGPDCTHPGKCEGHGIVKCVPNVKKDEFDFGIEELFEI